MKRLIIIILVLIAIGIGFYFGYQHTNERNGLDAKVVKAPSVVPQQSIVLEYRAVVDKEIENEHSKGSFQVSYDSTNKDILIFKGKGALATIISCIQHRGDENVNFSIPRKPGEQVYEFTLSYHRDEYADDLFNMLGSEFGFTYQLASESTETNYSANTKNFKNLQPRPSGDFKPEIIKEGTIYKFRNATTINIMDKFMEEYQLYVSYVPRTKGGVFNVDINMPASMEEAISDIREKTGIEIGTKQVKAKTFIIKRL